jgi:hypothetical protein
MTEKTLFTYLDAKMKFDNLMAALAEYKNKLLSPKTQILSFLPFSESTGESNLPDKLDTLIRLESARDKARDEMEKGISLLTYLMEILDRPTERQYLLDRYFFGIPTARIALNRNRGRTSLYRDRDGILEKISQLTFA